MHGVIICGTPILDLSHSLSTLVPTHLFNDGGNLPKPHSAGSGVSLGIRRVAPLGTRNSVAKVRDNRREAVQSGDPARQNSTRTVCIWKLDLHLVDDVYKLIQRGCSRNVFTQISSIRRICQKNTKVRFEIDIPETAFESLLHSLSKATKRFDMSIREKSSDLCEAMRIRCTRRFPSPHTPIRLCSWNINGFSNKREELEAYLALHQIQILGIQETRRKADHWRLFVKGYNCVEVTSTPGAGQRGIALLVRADLSAFSVGRKSQYFIFARIFGKNVVKPMIVCTVYLPHRHANTHIGGDSNAVHKQAKLDFLKELAHIHRKYPHDKITIFGDFNRNSIEVLRLLRKTDGFHLIPLSNEEEPRRQNGRGRAIDHFVSNAAGGLFTNGWQDESIDLSDHYPIMIDLQVQLRNSTEDPPKQRVRWCVPKRSSESQALIAAHNSFAVLSDHEEDGDDNADHLPLQGIEEEQHKITRQVSSFIEACNKLGNELGWRSVENPTQRSFRISNKFKKLSVKRRALYIQYKEIKRIGSEVEVEVAFRAYKEMRKLSNKATKEDKRNRWTKAVCDANTNQSRDPKKFWHWVSASTGWKKREYSTILQPMMDRAGEVQTEGEAVREVWRDHYKGLAADVTGHSQDKTYWTNLWPDSVPPRNAEIHELNVVIDSYEVLEALRKVKPNKAPGPDDIPAAFFKSFAASAPVDETDAERLVREGPLTALTATLNSMWIGSFIPDSSNLASVVSIFKKDDPTNANNYRGISLIDAITKLLASILTHRLQHELEEREILVKGQSGFREKEESVAQALALYEIIKRRENVGSATYALFLDYQKAFDTVPHEALFHKLNLIGVRGRMLQFIRTLYSNSMVQVRTNDGVCSEPFRLLRGVRQGCPMSPVLFNIYINTMFDGCKKGAKIPLKMKRGKDANGETTETVVYLPHRAPGLLFADDAALLAGSRKGLLSNLKKVVIWSDEHELLFGVGKCGLMRFGNAIEPDIVGLEELYYDGVFSNKRHWQIHGTPIPVVASYTYLGLEFTPDLCLSRMAKERMKKGRKALYQFEAFFKCATFPYVAKITVLKAVVVSTMLYGAEIWGMKVGRATAQQTLVNQALRWILNLRGPISLQSAGAMCTELGIDCFRSLVATRRTRAYVKYRSLNTWISILCLNPLRLRTKNWVTITEQWLNRFVKAQVGKSRPSLGGPNFCDDIKVAIARTRAYAMEAQRKVWATKARSFVVYCNANFSPLLQIKGWVPNFGTGFLLVLLFRGNGYWLMKRLANCHFSYTRYENYCPFCKTACAETSSHLIIHCTKWTDIRRKFIGRMITISRLMCVETAPERVAEHDLWITDLLLGGEVSGRKLPDWLPEVALGEVETNARFDDSTDETGDAPFWSRCGLYQIAGFLAVVNTERKRWVAETRSSDRRLHFEEPSLAPTTLPVNVDLRQDPYG